MLTLLTAQLGDGTTDDVITAAEAIEITHLASLYHDDVMDERRARRGVPSAQTVWGNSVAILTGDLLFARASQLMARSASGRSACRPTPSSGSCSGSCTRPSARSDGDDPIEHYIQVLADKTGSLIAAAAQVGRASSRTPTRARGRRSSSSARRSASRSSSSTTSSTCRRSPRRPARSPAPTCAPASSRCRCCASNELAKTDAASAALLERIRRDVLRPRPPMRRSARHEHARVAHRAVAAAVDASSPSCASTR